MLLADERWRKSRAADGYFARPELDPDLAWHLAAWFDMSSDRREATSSIPYSSIAGFAQRHSIEGEDFDRFKVLIRSLDGEYLDRTSRQIAQQTARR